MRTASLNRRAVLLLPFLLSACGDDDEPPRPARREFPPLRYAYLPPIELNVARIEISRDFVPPAGKNEVSTLSPTSPAETLFAMAHDRLKPTGNAGGLATFTVRTASITRDRDTLNGTLIVRLDMRNDDGSSTGFAEARAVATQSGVNGDPTAAIYDLLKTLMNGMNVELEYQIRGKLRAWIYEAPPPVPEPVNPSEPLPLPPVPPKT